jgi:hypothetical protein
LIGAINAAIGRLGRHVVSASANGMTARKEIDVAFVAAGVGAALFATSFAIGGSPARTTDRAGPAPARVTAWIAPASAGVGGTF